MNPIYIITMLIMFFMLAGIWLYLSFTRAGKNLVTKILFNKKYVICHLKNSSTDFIEIWRIVPEKDFITTVGKGKYNLNPAYALLNFNHRLHFMLSENDVIPQYIKRTNTNDEIVIQVKEVKTALENKAYELLYGKYKDIAMVIACIGLLIAICVSVYAIYTIQNISPMIEYLYAHPPAQEVVKVVAK
jgi:hypothetical protein